MKPVKEQLVTLKREIDALSKRIQAKREQRVKLSKEIDEMSNEAHEMSLRIAELEEMDRSYDAEASRFTVTDACIKLRCLPMDELAQVVAEVLKLPNILGSVQRISDPMVARAVGMGLRTTTGLLSGDDTGQLRQHVTRFDVGSPNFGKEHAPMRPQGAPVTTSGHDATPRARFYCTWRNCGIQLTSESPGYCSVECPRVIRTIAESFQSSFAITREPVWRPGDRGDD